jgi:hypothetical protein
VDSTAEFQLEDRICFELDFSLYSKVLVLAVAVVISLLVNRTIDLQGLFLLNPLKPFDPINHLEGLGGIYAIGAS